jgi:hypothetical protein
MRPPFHDLVTVPAGSADNLGGDPMAPLIESIRSAISSPRGGRPVCLVCGRTVSPGDESMRLRGGALVHRDCAAYDTQRRHADAFVLRADD